MANKPKMLQGIQKVSTALPLFFVGPVVINSAFKNQEHPWYWPVLLLGIFLCGYGAYRAFKGITTITSAIFDHV